MGETAFSCGPHKGWSPTAYSADPCWGPTPHASCGSEEEEHHVAVVVRSAADPFLAAEELTGSSFDFGLSPHSQRVYGATILAFGVLLLLPPGIVCCEWLHRRRKTKNDEKVPLDGARCTWHHRADCTRA